jgi:hypothetical protein
VADDIDRIRPTLRARAAALYACATITPGIAARQLARFLRYEAERSLPAPPHHQARLFLGGLRI